MRTHDITRLPKWAQDEFLRLQYNEVYWKKKATAGPEDSNTFIQHYPENRPLGDSPRIVYRWGDQEVMVCIMDGHLRVEAQHGALHVIPSASNSIRLRVGDY